MTEYNKSVDLFKTKAQNFTNFGHNRVSAVISKAELHSLPEQDGFGFILYQCKD